MDRVALRENAIGRRSQPMITTDFCATMARYNEWMNRRLYAACDRLGDEERKRDRGAFFKSIHSSLNHIVYADLAFFSRFTGTPPVVPELGVDLHDDFAELTRARAALDARILDWAVSLQPDWLRDPLTYTSKVDGRLRTVPRWVLVCHLFNHQAHHRGQVTTLLSQAGIDMGTTDLPFMPEFSSPDREAPT
jgi:uncharacterized damage-inducible protein DinB